jgi:hypothetical protein
MDMAGTYRRRKLPDDDNNRIVEHSVFAFCLPGCRSRETTPRYRPPWATLASSALKLQKTNVEEISKRCEWVMARTTFGHKRG